MLHEAFHEIRKIENVLYNQLPSFGDDFCDVFISKIEHRKANPETKESLERRFRAQSPAARHHLSVEEAVQSALDLQADENNRYYDVLALKNNARLREELFCGLFGSFSRCALLLYCASHPRMAILGTNAPFAARQRVVSCERQFCRPPS
jgi:hypothetical protein